MSKSSRASMALSKSIAKQNEWTNKMCKFYNNPTSVLPSWSLKLGSRYQGMKPTKKSKEIETRRKKKQFNKQQYPSFYYGRSSTE